MRFPQLQQYVYRSYAPIFVLEHTIETPDRRRVTRVLGFALLATIFLVGVSFFSSFIPQIPLWVVSLDTVWLGASFVLLSVWLTFSLLEWFRRSYYYRGLETVIEEMRSERSEAATFEVASIVYESNPNDISEGFIYSYFGGVILKRLGLDPEDLGAFLSDPNRVRVLGEEFVITQEGALTISRYAGALYQKDTSLQTFLFSKGIQESDFSGAALFVEEIFRARKLAQRWWSRDNLGRMPAIGRSLGYGQTFALERYGHPITHESAFLSSGFAWREREEVDKLEAILARNRQANALLIGEAGIGKLEIIARVARRILEGEALPALMDKQVFVLDAGALVASGKGSGTLEVECANIFSQAARAGNIIMVIRNISAFIEGARVAGVDVIDLLTPYFSTQSMQLVFTTDPQQFHHHLSNNGTLMQYFDTVHVEDLDDAMLIRVLGRESLALEARSRVYFTYQALQAVARGGDRYFPDGVMPDKGFDLMQELVARARATGIERITTKEVEALIESKTGIPTGAPKPEEQRQLLNLEKLLHERIVGQEAAVSAIAQAMRRARSGVRNEGKPMGSFLFLGPTGVGKTATTKALAHVFFGNEENIMRLDMSEYRGADALDRLIGSFESGRAGILSSMLREKQYGILLLDEFEKTSPDVHDLFLQILDEGQFSDASGKRVNARNLIIIATSNAASDRIWEYFKEGEDVAEHERELIDEIIGRGIFKPELLNRFDGTVVFHPLSEKEIRAIATLMLGGLQERLRSQGLNLEITDSLVDTVVRHGYDPQFGARPMNRAIQEHVEQKVADGLLRGDIKRGGTVRL